jgi:hypothetical protein
MKFVALGVATEIIVIFQDKNLCVGARPLAVEMRGCETADSSTHDDEIVSFVETLRTRRVLPESAVAQAVGYFE